jgi:hypothetical protein
MSAANAALMRGEGGILLLPQCGERYDLYSILTGVGNVSASQYDE